MPFPPNATLRPECRSSSSGGAPRPATLANDTYPGSFLHASDAASGSNTGTRVGGCGSCWICEWDGFGVNDRRGGNLGGDDDDVCTPIAGVCERMRVSYTGEGRPALTGEMTRLA